MGFSFKENTDDIRNTKVVDLVYFLNKKIKFVMLKYLIQTWITLKLKNFII